jgi:predicted nucleic acid-binding Zn ribbon protein
MPTYVYAVINDDGSDGETFEVFQKMTDDPLTEHPETGRPVRRIPQAPNIAGKWSEGRTKQLLSDSNLDRMGFTKYQKTGDGQYEKRAGEGPATIDTND